MKEGHEFRVQRVTALMHLRNRLTRLKDASNSHA